MIILDILFGIYFLGAGVINSELMCSFGFGVWQASSYFAKPFVLYASWFLATKVELVFIQWLNHVLCLSLFSCCYFHLFAPSMGSAFHCFHVVTFIYLLHPFNFYIDNLYHCHHYLLLPWYILLIDLLFLKKIYILLIDWLGNKMSSLLRYLCYINIKNI